MKIISILLAVALLLLGAHYSVLYLDNQTLQKQLDQQKTEFDEQLKQERQTYEKKIDNLQEFIAFGQTSRQGATSNASIVTTAPTSAKLNKFAEIQQENMKRTLDKKYSMLMSRLGLSGQAQSKLQELLLQREQILGATSVGYYSTQAETDEAIRRQQESLAEIDWQIAQLLNSPEDKKTYELLKDSAYEQYQMNSFFDEMQGSEAVPAEKREALLISKLEQKQELMRYLEGAGQAIEKASDEEKSFLVEKAYETLHNYKDNYLSTARATLTESQYDALREQEQKHFEEIWASLKAGWLVE
jgi:hypothetical protein